MARAPCLALERRAREVAAERDQAPVRAVRVEREADMGAERVRVAEDALDRVGVVDAVRPGHRVQEVHRLGAELRRVGDVPLDPELLLDVHDAAGRRRRLSGDAVAAEEHLRRLDPRARRADPQLHGLEVAHAHPGVVRAARLDRLAGELERGLRVAERGAGEAMGAERRDRDLVERARIGARAGEAGAAAAARHVERPVLRNEHVLRPHRLRAGRPHAEHVPVVDDLVLGAVHQAHAPAGDAVAVVHLRGEHVPLRRIDAAREVPVPADREPAVDLFRAALRERDPRGDQRVGVRAPHLVLRAFVVQREHPVVDAEVADVPRGGRAAARELGRDVDERHEVELHPAVPLRLREPEEPGAMQVGFGLGQHLPRGLAARRALAQRGHERGRPRERLVVADCGESRRRCIHLTASGTRAISA